MFPDGSVNGDLFVIALPMAAGRNVVALIAFIGGFSAATGMVIMSCVALSTMVSNDLVMPIVLHGRRLGLAEREDMGAVILGDPPHRHRRGDAARLRLLPRGQRRAGPRRDRAAQLRRHRAVRAAAAGRPGVARRQRDGRDRRRRGRLLGVGLLPDAAGAGPVRLAFAGSLVANGPFGIAFLRPEALFGLHFDPLTNGTLWSLAANIVCYVGVSRLFPIRVIERVQASAFVDLDPGQASFEPRAWRGPISVGELTGLVARYLGAERVQRAFADLAARRGIDYAADAQADFTSCATPSACLASAIGAPSARLVLALALERRNLGLDAAMGLLDDASAAIQYNRELLQETLETVRQGISVFDRELRLVCWNRHFRDLLELPADLVRVGVPLQEIIQFFAARGEFGAGDPEEIVARQLDRFVGTGETVFENRRRDGRVFEIRTNPMIGGGYVTTYSDISEHVQFASELAAANELLERRVRERTEELSAAKAVAEEANIGKTRFLAAASHDLLQPLNAARLYVASLLDHQTRARRRRIAGRTGTQDRQLARRGRGFARRTARYFAARRRACSPPSAATCRSTNYSVASGGVRADRGTQGSRIDRSCRRARWSRATAVFCIVSCKICCRTRSAIPASGRILMGVRRAGDHVVIQVADTGIGIAPDKRGLIFQEFQHFAAPGTEQGVGLGLSIVERIGTAVGSSHRLPVRTGTRHDLQREGPARQGDAHGTAGCADDHTHGFGIGRLANSVHRQ